MEIQVSAIDARIALKLGYSEVFFEAVFNKENTVEQNRLVVCRYVLGTRKLSRPHCGTIFYKTPAP